MADYGARKTIHPNSDTWWSVLHIIAMDILASKVAIQNMLKDPEWTQLLAGPNAPAMALRATEGMGNERYWTALQCVITLGKPIAQAITQLQGDIPKLSSVLPVWWALRTHADTWDANMEVPPWLKAGTFFTGSRD